MFAQESTYGEYMDKFFAEHHHPTISWIHDLGRGRHGAASETLLAVSQDTNDLQIKHVRAFRYPVEKVNQYFYLLFSSC